MPNSYNHNYSKITTESMWSTLKTVSTILKLVFFLLAIGLSIANIHSSFYSNKTTTSTSIVNISSIEFPLKISIFVYPGFILSNYTGYYDFDPAYFFSGVSRFGMSRIGWAGHTEQGGTLGTVTGRTTSNALSN